MTALIDRNRGRGVGIVGIVALAVWFILCAGPVRAQVAPLPPQEEPDDDPPRKDVRMGNTENMRMGRDAEGNVVMEVRAPRKDPASQPQVGPFFIYPQVGMPPRPGGGPGGQSGSQMGGQSGGQSGQSVPVQSAPATTGTGS